MAVISAPQPHPGGKRTSHYDPSSQAIYCHIPNTDIHVHKDDQKLRAVAYLSMVGRPLFFYRFTWQGLAKTFSNQQIDRFPVKKML